MKYLQMQKVKELG